MGEGEIAGPLSRFIAMDRQGLAPDHLPALDPAGGGDELPGEAPRGQHAGEHPSENHVGEVVESSTAEALAQARELNRAPCFGRFVLIQSVVPAVGIVFNVSTQSIEANRRPVAYGKTERELRLEQPQIFELLRTHFQILIVGHLDRAGDRRGAGSGPVENDQAAFRAGLSGVGSHAADVPSKDLGPLGHADAWRDP